MSQFDLTDERRHIQEMERQFTADAGPEQRPLVWVEGPALTSAAADRAAAPSGVLPPAHPLRLRVGRT